MVASSRRYVPKEPSDWLAFAFFFTAIHIVGFFELLVILPYIDANASGTYWLHVCIGLYLYVNIMMAYALIVSRDTRTNRDGVIMPSILKSGWRFCSSCEANAPPRSYHCWSCDVCILRRDHHCVFAGQCIGFANHRYFISLMFLTTVATMYCNFLNMDYTFEMLHGLSLKSAFTMIMPLFAWMLGLTEAYSFFVAFVSALCIFGFLLSGGLFLYHMMNLVHGQTTYEKAQQILQWDLGWRQNFEDVLGRRWYLMWLGPWLPSPLGGNGIDFTNKHERMGLQQSVKDL